MERKSSWVVVLVLTGNALAAAWTWRDIRQQPAEQVRGSKTLWRISSAVNTLGSVGLLADRPPLPEVSAAVTQRTSATALMSLT